MVSHEQDSLNAISRMSPLQVAHAPGASITATMAIGMRWSLARAHLRYV